MNKLSLTFILLSAITLQARIIEKPRFKSFNYYVQKYKPRDVLAVVDLDNTVFRPARKFKGFGGDFWFSAMTKRHGDYRKVLPAYLNIQKYIDLIPLEKNTPSYIRKLQRKGYNVIALTARSEPIAGETIQQLKKMGVSFKSSLHKDVDGCLRMKWYFRGGIAFCQGNDKGAVLLKVLDCMNISPKKVIFIDDGLKNVSSVEKAIGEDSLLGIHYTFSERYRKKFNLDVANDVAKRYKIPILIQ